jgi:flagellar biosynthesis protein
VISPTDRRRAVAVRYRPGMEGASGDHAPHVTAKGAGDTADRIISLARRHGIPLHEDRDLVQLLGVLDLDAEIPPTLYRALAEVLAHLYRLNGRR